MQEEVKKPIPTKPTPSPSKKKTPKDPIIWIDIDDIHVIRLIEERGPKFNLPQGGIHKASIWKTAKSVGVQYKVLANLDLKAIEKPRSAKNLIVQLKWVLNQRMGYFMPAKGFEDAQNVIERGDSSQIIQCYKPAPA